MEDKTIALLTGIAHLMAEVSGLENTSDTLQHLSAARFCLLKRLQAPTPDEYHAAVCFESAQRDVTIKLAAALAAELLALGQDQPALPGAVLADSDLLRALAVADVFVSAGNKYVASRNVAAISRIIATRGSE